MKCVQFFFFSPLLPLAVKSAVCAGSFCTSTAKAALPADRGVTLTQPQEGANTLMREAAFP